MKNDWAKSLNDREERRIEANLEYDIEMDELEKLNVLPNIINYTYRDIIKNKKPKKKKGGKNKNEPK